jgi:flagellar hook assembly protein FlgD
VTKSEESQNNLPDNFALGQNYPNPFNSSTTIEFQLPTDSEISLAIFNINGRKITTLEQGHYKAGYHNTYWSGKNRWQIDVSSGIYIARMLVNDKTFSRKLILVR